MTVSAGNNSIIKGFERRKLRQRMRNQAIKRWYEFYFVEDQYAEQGQVTLSTPDSRNAVDLGVYILSRNPHMDRIPQSVQSKPEGQRMNMGERFLSGGWRTVDWLNIMRGTSWHQRRLAAWLLMTGWYAQFTAIIPDSTGKPQFVADLWDPATIYPEWGGYRGILKAVEHEYYYPLGSLREMAQANGWTAPDLKGDDDTIAVVMDHWESKHNRLDPSQPDILNSVYVSTSILSNEPHSIHVEESDVSWLVLQDETNRRTDSKKGGFVEIPVMVGPAGGVEVSSAYTRNASLILSKTGQGLLAPLEGVQDAINREVSTLLQEVEASRLGQATPVITSDSGTETLTPSEMGKAQSYRTGTNISYPHRFGPQLQSAQLVINFLNEIFQRSTFPWVSLGQASFSLSGVAIERLNESARSHLEPFHYMMRHIYQMTGYVWLRDYKRRWGERSTSGRIRLAGGVMGSDLSGYFDEEFSPENVPDTQYIISEIPWGLVEDDMMKANIAQQLSAIMSRTWIRENIVKVQDDQLEVRRKAGDNIEEAPVYVNAMVYQRFRDEAAAALDRGDRGLAEILGKFAAVLLESLAPQQGRGIPERPGQGPPAAGGNFSNAGGGRPELSPQNQPPALRGTPEAPAGGGPLEQAARNI